MPRDRGVDVSICILNRNQKDLLRGCLASCFDELARSGLVGEIIVVDNASEDGSPEMVAEVFTQVRVIRNQENATFSRGNNQAIEAASGRFVLVLNNDTVILPGCLETLVKYMDSKTRVGIAGPKLLRPDGTVQLSYHRRLPRLADVFTRVLFVDRFWPGNPIRKRAWLEDELLDENSIEPCPIEQIAGCCMMLRRQALDTSGLFDEDFQYGYEDVDLCQRFNKSAWGVSYVPKAQIVHYGAASFAALEPEKVKVMFMSSLLRYFRKHKGSAQYGMVKIMILIASFARLIVFSARSLSRSRWAAGGGRNVSGVYWHFIVSMFRGT